MALAVEPERSVLRTFGLFVTATDTGVGKTYITASIARSLRDAGRQVGAYKPVCSGAETLPDGTLVWRDVESLVAAIGNRYESNRVCPQRLRAALAPPVAARSEGALVDFEQLRNGADWWKGRVDVLLVEGIGGLLCPLTEDETIADFAVALGYPVLLVARLGLGTINHTLLTIEAARRRGLAVAGVILNEAERLASSLGGSTPGIEENAPEIARRANVPVLGVVRHGGMPAQLDWWPLITSLNSASPAPLPESP